MSDSVHKAAAACARAGQVAFCVCVVALLAGGLSADNVTVPQAPAVAPAADNTPNVEAPPRFAPDETVDDLMKRQEEEKGKTGTGLPDMPGTDALVRMLGWLAAICVGIYAAVYVFRKYVPNARNMFGSGVLKIVGRTYIASKQYILLVKVGSKFVLVGVTGTTMTSLGEVDDPEDVERITRELAADSGHVVRDSFKNVMRGVDTEYEEKDASEPADPDADISSLRGELDDIAKKMNHWRHKKEE